jgi:RelA/SpoT family (p)ppGpp synthetase
MALPGQRMRKAVDTATSSHRAMHPSRPAPLSKLKKTLSKYLEQDDIDQVVRAYHFGADAHTGQKRQSGEPYIYHPLEVAQILAEMQMGLPTIIAAILHDTIEDTPTLKEQLADEFGEDVAGLVDGVSKLTQARFRTKAEAHAENFRKMLLAMTWDIRVILIKLADRVHNMRTIGAMPREKQRRIAQETLEIYAPIAHRLGMNSIRQELHDLCFLTIYPTRYRVVAKHIRSARGNRREVVKKIRKSIAVRLKEENIKAEVVGREKTPWSIYQKMRDQQRSLVEVVDVHGFRIVVDSVSECYQALGTAHNLYKPMPGRFKDYIAIPKANGYQSLHTVLFGPYGSPVEIQIRTRDMDIIAERGIAAHWMYKTGADKPNMAQNHARDWVVRVLEMQKQAGDSAEFLEHVKIDLFPDEVYVFTPKGKILDLPRSATVVDFAYAVHTDVGNHCVAARVDGELAPLRARLESGQTVEIISADSARPDIAWLNFVVTSKARAAIRHYLKNLERGQAIEIGGRLLDNALGAFNSSLDKISKRTMRKFLMESSSDTLEDLLADVGLGNKLPLVIAKQLIPKEKKNGEHGGITDDTHTPGVLAIRGTENIVVSFANCCHPIPGDPVIGFVSAGHGIVIHTANCKNATDSERYSERWIDVTWEPELTSEFPVGLRLEVTNKPGVLATLAATMAEMGSNIENVEVRELDAHSSVLTFVLSVRDRPHLANIMRRLRGTGLVFKIQRLNT